MLETILVILSIVLILSGAIFYVVKSKIKGKKCIGCPYACSCEKKICNERKKA